MCNDGAKPDFSGKTGKAHMLSTKLSTAFVSKRQKHCCKPFHSFVIENRGRLKSPDFCV